MNIQVVQGDIARREDAAVVVNLFEGVTHPSGSTGAMDAALDGAVTDLIAEGDVRGGRGDLALIYTLGKTPAKRAVVAGLGESEKFDANAARQVHAETARFLRGKRVRRFSTVLHGAGIGGLDVYQCARAAAEGVLLGAYSFDKHKSDPKPEPLEAVAIVEYDPARIPEIERGVADGTAVANAVNLARDMGNEPANHMTPTRMAEIALEIASENDAASLAVFDRADIESMGMGAFAGVAQGTEEPPKLIVLRYDGDPDNPANNLALIGKGITFDSGGLDIKSASGMLTMKSDMSGGACVIGAMKAIAALAPKINVWAIVPATENMPGRRAQRPGDVVRAMNGKTIEIGNTDAEGRLVLADALCYAVQNGLTRLVDVATLTGAVRIALGGRRHRRLRKRLPMGRKRNRRRRSRRRAHVAPARRRFLQAPVQKRHRRHQQHRRRRRRRDHRSHGNRRIRRRNPMGAPGHRRHDPNDARRRNQPQGLHRRTRPNPNPTSPNPSRRRLDRIDARLRKSDRRAAIPSFRPVIPAKERHPRGSGGRESRIAQQRHPREGGDKPAARKPTPNPNGKSHRPVSAPSFPRRRESRVERPTRQLETNPESRAINPIAPFPPRHSRERTSPLRKRGAGIQSGATNLATGNQARIASDESPLP